MWDLSDIEAVNTTVSAPAPAPKARTHTILPMFIKFLNDLNDDFSYCGETVQMVSLIAMVRSQVISSTRVIYKLADFTDSIDAHLWLDFNVDSQETPNVPNIMIDSYCRVVGTLKAGDKENNRRIFILSIVPMKCFDELLVHNLQVVEAKLELLKKNDGGSVGDVGTSSSTGVNQTSGDEQLDKTLAHIGNAFQISVYKAIAKCTVVNGMHLDALQNIIKADKKAILTALQHLQEQGHIYTTVSDDFFKSTEDL